MKPREVLIVITFLCLALVTLVGSPPAAYGCSCMDVDLEDFADEVDLAFVGQQVSRVVHHQVGDNGATLTFEVETVYKGEVPPEVNIATNSQDSACGMDFSEAGQVAVVATMWRGKPSVNLCRSFVTEAEFQHEFGDGYLPDPIAVDGATTAGETIAIVGSLPDDEAVPDGVPTWIYLGGAGLVLVAGVGLIAWRRSRSDLDLAE